MRRLLFSTILLLAACENYRFGATDVGALGGAAAGAGLGAIIGHQTGHTGGGIAIGSAAGALGGALIGSQIERQDRALENNDRRIAENDKMLAENRKLLEELRQRGIDVRDSDRGIVVNLPDVLFGFNSANLTPHARSTVREIADVINQAPARRISVEGHTDSIGTIDYNYRLSDSRARAVRTELERSNVAPRRITTRALGESEPIASNRTDQGRRRNRRVEVIIENVR
jgi:outer membrane protein OmpA-like peptidoglycan-associated protein